MVGKISEIALRVLLEADYRACSPDMLDEHIEENISEELEFGVAELETLAVVAERREDGWYLRASTEEEAEEAAFSKMAFETLRKWGVKA